MGRRSVAALLLAISLLPIWSVSAAPNGPLTPALDYPATGFVAPPWLAVADAPITVMVQLTARPGTQRASAQDEVSARLARLGVTELFRTHTVYQGVAVIARPSQLAQLRSIPGVTSVSPITPKARLEAAPTPTQSARAAIRFAGATGRGSRIAVIDSGIDYTHATFGGPGTAVAYSNPARTFPTAKVIGGYDFAGDAYDASGAAGSRTPTPDTDPLDCNGHGTQVAGLAAGQGVTASGQPYAGPYSGDLSALAVPPGVAPEATLYAFKIFGCTGTTALVSLAIDQAVALQPDVIVLALGTAFGGANDPDSLAVERAVAAGITVVAAAGDGGDSFYAVSSPASDPAALAVGASGSGALGVLPVSARGPARDGTLKPDLLAPGEALVVPALRTGTGTTTLSGTSAAAPQVAGVVAILRQQHPAWSPQQIRAALVNTAVPVGAASPGPLAPPSLAGAGEIGPNALRNSQILVYPSSGGGVSFGYQRAARRWSASQPITIQNLSAAPQQVQLSTTATVTLTDVTVAAPGGLITVPPRGSTTVSVTASFDPAALNAAAAPGTALAQDGLARYALSERGGTVNVVTRQSRVRAANAAAVLTALDVQIDDADPLTAPLNTASAYQPTVTGSHRVRVWASPADRTVEPLLDTTVVFPSVGDYTVVVQGAQGAVHLSLAGPEPAPPAGQTVVTLVNAAPYGALDVYSNGLERIAAGLASGESRSVTLPAGGRVIGYFRAGQAPTRASLVAWAVYDGVATTRYLMGAGDTANLSGYDAACKTALEQLAASSPEFKALFDARAGDADFFNAVCTAGRRIVYAVSKGGPAVERASIAYQLFPASASETQTADSLVVPDGATSAALTISNVGARRTLPGEAGGANSALVSALEVAGSSPALAGIPAAADLRWVGVSSSYPIVGDVSASQFYIGIAAAGPWATPNEVQFLTYIDSTGAAGGPDGRNDFVIVSTSYGAANPSGSRQPNDVFINVVYRLTDSGAVGSAVSYTLWNTLPATDGAGQFDPAPFGARTVTQAVSGQVLGLTAGQSRFNFHVETRARDADGFQRVVDRIPAAGQPDLSYDPTRTALTPISAQRLSQRPIFLDGFEPVTLTVDQAELARATLGRQVLLLHLHNQAENQAELVTVRSAKITALLNDAQCCYRTRLPNIGR